jgi:putative transposase
MSRPLRISYPGAWYHVMNRGASRKDIFLNDRHRELFLQILFEIHNRYRIEIHAYCLMRNHYHLLLRTPLGNISRAMRHLDGVYTQRFNKITKRDGPLFRGRYKAILVEADAYLLRLSRYIHLNPVTAKLSQFADQYRWSSYNGFIKGNEPDWLYTRTTLSYFEDDSRQKYIAFVNDGADVKWRNYYQNKFSKPILGNDDFVKSVSDKYLLEKHKIKEIPEHKSLKMSSLNPIETIIETVANYYNLNTADLMTVKRKLGNMPRNMAIYISKYIGQHNSSKIASVFNNITSSSVLKSCRRFHEIIYKNEMLKNDLDELIHQLERAMSYVQT